MQKSLINSTYKIGLTSALTCLITLPASAQSPAKYDILSFKKATSEIVMENCKPSVAADVSLDNQLTSCKALIPELKQIRANFVGEGFQANFRWADDRLDWQVGNVYRNMAAKIISSGQGLSSSSCGYIYSWKAHLLKMDENPREFFTRYDKMMETADSTIEKCKTLGHVTALE